MSKINSHVIYSASTIKLLNRKPIGEPVSPFLCLCDSCRLPDRLASSDRLCLLISREELAIRPSLSPGTGPMASASGAEPPPSPTLPLSSPALPPLHNSTSPPSCSSTSLCMQSIVDCRLNMRTGMLHVLLNRAVRTDTTDSSTHPSAHQPAPSASRDTTTENTGTFTIAEARTAPDQSRVLHGLSVERSTQFHPQRESEATSVRLLVDP